MRNRHIPRLCGSCTAPMGRQQDACWRCGTDWPSEAEPRTTLELIHGGAGATGVDRWTNEGGSLGSEAPLRAAAAR